jgi:hypothetical protein
MDLKVPLIIQDKPMACWYAGAQMLYAYKRASIDPLHNVYVDDKGIRPSQFIDLAAAAGLKTIPRVNQTYDWTFIDSLLKAYGPIWAAGYWYGSPHVIVITGVDSGGALLINDPGFASPQFRDMGWFNKHIATDVPIPMMYLP